MSVEVDLTTTTIPIPPSLGGITEQRVWKSLKGAQLRLVTLTAHVDDDALTPAR